MPIEGGNVLLFFIDGLGIGERNEYNPLSMIGGIEPLANFKNETAIQPFDGILVPTDPRLGIDGRPQSASGQTTILTGVNVPQQLGYHKQGFPNAEMREILAERSIFKQLDELAIGPNAFANTYTPRFFTEKPRWKSATTCAVEASKTGFRKIPDLLGKKALFHDFTNGHLQSMGFDVPTYTVEDGAEILSGLAAENRFTLYEHFITDKIGHDQDHIWAEKHLPQLASLIRETIARLDLETTTFILTSDHGNIEDLSKRNHTLNDVPTIIWGRRRRETADEIKSLADITPAIIGLLK